VSDIRFYVDESVSNAVAEGLRTRQLEVLTTPEAGHMGWSDEEHLTFARENHYVLITQDDDFLTLARKTEHAGIAYYKPNTRNIKEILRGLFALHQ
jgi:predicted nuclease of predicted toxin-antitoxin system